MRPQDIKNTALLTIEGELDDISGCGQTRAAHDLCPGVAVKNKHHYVIFSGYRWRTIVSPQLGEFILAHDKALKNDAVRA